MITSPSAGFAPLRFCAIVLPLTVSASPWIFFLRSSSAITVGTPPARWNASPRYLPAGMQFTSSGMSYPILSQSALTRFTPMWRAIALMCGGQLVEAPSALAATIAFSNALRVMMSDGFKSSHTMSTMRLPVS